MKSLNDASFFRVFDAVVSAGNPGLKRTAWNFAGVAWTRERHSFAGAGHSFAVGVFTTTHAGRAPWTLVTVREYWWGADQNDELKHIRWARPTVGRASEVLSWFRGQARALGQ